MHALILGLLLAAAPFGGTTPVPVSAQSVESALSLYVDPTGSDANPCTASGTSACLTIQGAIEKVPRRYRADVTINVAAGTFAGFRIHGFTAEATGTNTNPMLRVQGTLSNSTLATGNVTGTGAASATGSGSTFTTFTPTAAPGWTVSDLKGRFLVITGGTGNGTIRVIDSNTATALTIPSTSSIGFTPDGTTQWAIQDSATIINSHSYIANNQVGRYQLVSDVGGIEVSRLRFVGTNTATLYIGAPGGANVTDVQSVLSSTGNSFYYGAGAVGTLTDVAATTLATCFLFDAAGTTPGFFSTTRLYCSGGTAVSVGGGMATISGGFHLTGANADGLTISGTARVGMTGRIDCQSTSNSFGVLSAPSSTGSAFGLNDVNLISLDISNCTTAISTGVPGLITMKTVTGTGNTTAINLAQGARAKIYSDTTLTGTTELNVDGSTSTLATMRAASPRVFPTAANAYGTVAFE